MFHLLYFLFFMSSVSIVIRYLTISNGNQDPECLYRKTTSPGVGTTQAERSVSFEEVSVMFVSRSPSEKGGRGIVEKRPV
jgi:hypothetical protein